VVGDATGIGIGALASIPEKGGLDPRPAETPDLELEALFFDRELGQFRALHEVDDLFDLF
jgi:hypothetical protein